MFDRMIFKGHLSALYKQDGARCFLWTQGVALKDFTGYAKATTERIANHARKLATDAGRPVISFDHIKTRNRTQHKDELAKSIAEADGITEGIICLISAVESCWSFQVRRRHSSGRLELFRRERKCLHHYLYVIDPEFGFMHVRIVQPRRRCDRPRHPAGGDLSEELVPGEAPLDVAIAVAVRAELVHQPGPESGGRVVQREGEGVRPRAVDRHVHDRAVGLVRRPVLQGLLVGFAEDLVAVGVLRRLAGTHRRSRSTTPGE